MQYKDYYAASKIGHNLKGYYAASKISQLYKTVEEA